MHSATGMFELTLKYAWQFPLFSMCTVLIVVRLSGSIPSNSRFSRNSQVGLVNCIKQHNCYKQIGENVYFWKQDEKMIVCCSGWGGVSASHSQGELGCAGAVIGGQADKLTLQTATSRYHT